jgi:selenide,water dikinase
MWLVNPVPGASVTVVSAGPLAAYSGMLPGVLAGLYAPERALVDLYRLCRSAGVELITEPCTSVDPVNRRIGFENRPSVFYDFCSIGVGSVPGGLEAVQSHAGLVAIKPMPTTVRRIDAALQRIARSDVRVAVVGAGAAGVEVAFAIHARLLAAGRTPLVTLVDSHPAPLAGFRARTARKVSQLLNERGIQFRGGDGDSGRIIGATASDLLFDSGPPLPADLVLWVTRASPPPLLAGVPLPKSGSGFLAVRPTLQSTGDDRIFAVGDSAEFVGLPLDKAGVFAVRQGPVLWENLQRAIAGKRLRDFRPQRDFLRLLSTADGSAVMQYRSITAHGPRWWRLKDRIDSRFMKMHEPAGMTVPSSRKMTIAASSNGAAAMRCRGCGGKTSSRILSAVLTELRAAFPHQPPSFLQADDTAVVPAAGAASQAVSVDYFPAFLDDAWLTGRIAALHAMSDLWASGLTPATAVAMITLPDTAYGVSDPRRKQETLFDVLHGAITEFLRAGVTLTGGHTTDGDELTVGFTVLGPCDHALPFRKNALLPGQSLILTKPLGTGVILAARDQGLAVADDVESAIRMMLQSNATAAAIALEFGVSAATDITGFGLAGHLSEMLEQSGVGATLNLDALPMLPGAQRLLDAGVRSSLHEENAAAIPDHLYLVDAAGRRVAPNHVTAQVLFDPQTSGGLLLAIPTDRSADMCLSLRGEGGTAAVIAVTVPRSD